MPPKTWRNMYGNVEVFNQLEGQQTSYIQNPESADYDIYEEESIYEPIHGLEVTNKRTHHERTPRVSVLNSTRRNKARILLVTLAALLTISLLLIFLLLGLGFVKYSALIAELQEITSENGFLRSYASSTFQIFNEAHNKCAEVRDSRYITAVPCDTNSTGQQFQWLPGGRLLSMATRRCVGAPKKASKLPVYLYPCSEHSELQRWECPNDTLLALRGAELYFNYGNTPLMLVILYTRTGPWSRWVIHGTHNSVCSWSCEGSSPCQRGWAFFQGHCYYFSHSADSWGSASQWCLSQASVLVTIDSKEEQAYIAEATRTRFFWLGLTDQRSEGSWQWMDGTALSGTRYWAENEPNGLQQENCGSTRGDSGAWQDVSCLEKIQWICEKKV
ncbi:hypothetical protein NDU88_004828 [Pleurodeles waltl]|uniref:C-type lectin domain-containing protein n=1 Tax=Pleurodeles waltl TaxID=8319 RepID=A0AAV7T9L3_PLEWA|nr:hypothetical protein NDU88_004828 [Pleurodeles waltl]